MKSYPTYGFITVTFCALYQKGLKRCLKLMTTEIILDWPVNKPVMARTHSPQSHRLQMCPSPEEPKHSPRTSWLMLAGVCSLTTPAEVTAECRISLVIYASLTFVSPTLSRSSPCFAPRAIRCFATRRSPAKNCFALRHRWRNPACVVVVFFRYLEKSGDNGGSDTEFA